MRITPAVALLSLLALPGIHGCGAQESAGASDSELTEATGAEVSNEESGESLPGETGGDDFRSDTSETGEFEDAETGDEEVGPSPGDESTTEETGEEGTEEETEETGDAPVPPAEDPAGVITITETDPLFGDDGSADVQAGFHAPVDAGDPIESFGECRVDPHDPDTAAPAEPTLNAGKITIDGLLVPVSLDPETTIDGPVYRSNLAEEAVDLLGTPGSLISVQGNGGLDIPSFSLSVPTPTPIALISPATGVDKAIDTAKPLLITWNPDAGASRIHLSLAVLDYALEPVSGPIITCLLEGDPGSHVIPPEALGFLPTKLLHKIVVSVGRVHEETMETTSLPIRLTVTHTTAGIANAN